MGHCGSGRRGRGYAEMGYPTTRRRQWQRRRPGGAAAEAPASRGGPVLAQLAAIRLVLTMVGKVIFMPSPPLFLCMENHD